MTKKERAIPLWQWLKKFNKLLLFTLAIGCPHFVIFGVTDC